MVIITKWVTNIANQVAQKRIFYYHMADRRKGHKADLSLKDRIADPSN
jgi:hypothetical protein